MIDMGAIKIREVVVFIPAKLEKVIHNQHSYVCKSCERQSITSIKKGLFVNKD